jgi:hypothetical protein
LIPAVCENSRNNHVVLVLVVAYMPSKFESVILLYFVILNYEVYKMEKIERIYLIGIKTLQEKEVALVGMSETNEDYYFVVKRFQ